MKWLDDCARQLAYPLRATWVDKAFIVIQMAALIGLALLGTIALIERLA